MAVDSISRVVGAGALLLAMRTSWIARRERRRLSPKVICEEVQAPGETAGGGQLVALVRLSNPSGATAYNLRLGLELGGARISWGEDMKNPPRLNKLEAGAETGPENVLVPLGWAFDRAVDPWPDRVYWVDYQDAADWWWTTRNPWRGRDDLKVKRIGGQLRWWRHRQVQTNRQRRALKRGQRAGANALQAENTRNPG